MTDTPSPSPAPRHAAASVRREVIEIVRTTGAGLAIALALRVVVFQPFTIPSSSMEPGLVTGDYIVVSKLAYGWSRASFPLNPPLFEGRLLGRSAKRGDVVVFRLPRDPAQTWVKRVIGLPGDRVQVRGAQVFVNGEAIPRTPLGVTRDHDAPQRRVLAIGERAPNGQAYVTYDGGPGQPGDDTDVYVVPADQYFVMGDNRDNSLDSRFPRELGVGLLPAENLVGRAKFVLLSWRSGAALLKPWTWLNLQLDRFLKPIQ
ncbi:S26 family signal peptidase [Caulobacter sp. Root487D2Y]|uniref:signal peptidase I n=1 Tax=Caulobacter sp. Root487D2Y TaxID=1736547 RepID=UPI0006FB6F5B|nr:signal peptidase I [Caulobacter sp. Root487D2Y]KQY27386.1 S26 family signal peptidase [Caulobacter sp. Root487D2Y]